MPRFSIIVPTRNRPDTLKVTLNSCLNQKYGDYEIIVSDNASETDTRGLVASLNSSKIRYHKSSIRLSLADSWEFAVSHASGEYVILIGDDDGLFEYTLSVADQLLKKYPSEILKHQSAIYYWPEIPHIFANLAQFPIDFRMRFIDIHTDEWFSKLFQPLSTEFQPYLLPCIYHTFIRNNLIQSIISETGRLFHAHDVDLYSGFTLAHLAKSMLYLRYPLSIYAISNASNNFNMAIQQDYESLLQYAANDSEFRRHPWIPQRYLYSGIVNCADAFLNFRKTFQLSPKAYPFDRKLFLKKTLATLCSNDPRVLDLQQKALMECCSDDSRLQVWLNDKLQLQSASLNLQRSASLPALYDGNYFSIKGESIGIQSLSDMLEKIPKLYRHPEQLPVTLEKNLTTSRPLWRRMIRRLYARN
ncbi:MAG: glycosyltransferase family A protein [Zavarzinella sp.]